MIIPISLSIRYRLGSFPFLTSLALDAGFRRVRSLEVIVASSFRNGLYFFAQTALTVLMRSITVYMCIELFNGHSKFFVHTETFAGPINEVPIAPLVCLPTEHATW